MSLDTGPAVHAMHLTSSSVEDFILEYKYAQSIHFILDHLTILVIGRVVISGHGKIWHSVCAFAIYVYSVLGLG